MEVEFFDSLEEAQARLRQAMEAADARVRRWQAAVKVGDCFIADGGEEDLVVFGEVLEGYAEPRLRHYRFCRCFSVACPEGELGDVHVSTILAVVSRAFFDEMRQAGWQMEAGQRPCSSCRMMGGGVWSPAAGAARQAMAANRTRSRRSGGRCTMVLRWVIVMGFPPSLSRIPLNARVALGYAAPENETGQPPPRRPASSYNIATLHNPNLVYHSTQIGHEQRIPDDSVPKTLARRQASGAGGKRGATFLRFSPKGLS